mgnify:CR=1 FL=1
MKILSVEQFYKADAITIKKQKLRSVDLMERAATLCFNWLHEKLNGAQVSIHIFCGIGNNGGDGLVIARLLLIHGYQVNVYIANFTDKRSKDFLINYNLIKEVSSEWPILMTSEEDFPNLNNEDIIVDALFGIGLNRPPIGWVKKLIQHLNTSEAFKLAIDIPSGLYSNKAIEDGEAIVIADHTLTFQAPKLAFFLPETATYTLSFDVLDIGLDQEYLNSEIPLATIFDIYDAQELYQPRNTFDHKGTFGHSLIVGGSYGKIGATILASKAALKIGAGMVTVFVPKCGYSILQTALPEAMVITDSSNDNISAITVDFNPSVIGIGMGMGTNKKTVSALKEFFSNIESPLVIDADALNCISENKELLKLIPKDSILTPHPGELKRLIGAWEDDFQKIEIAKSFSEKHQIILIIKGANTLILNSTEMYINSTGNPGMATAGSGDVLTGIITGLLSQGYNALDAALFGVYIHGSAGDIASSYLGFEALIASDIIDGIGSAYLDLFKEETEEDTKTEA